MFTPNTGETQTGQIMCYKTGHIMYCQHISHAEVDTVPDEGYI